MTTTATDILPEMRRLAARFQLARMGIVFAWTAVLIYAASNSIVTSLVDIGATASGDSLRNPITFPNLLLLGSMLSLVPLALIFRRDLTRTNLRRLRPHDWRVLTLSAFLSSALTPGLFFFALSQTSVTNVVLVSRIEPPLFLLAAWLILNERFSARAMIAGLVALCGALVIIGMGDGRAIHDFGTGEWAAIAATLSYIASTLVARKGLRDVPMGIFAVYRTFAGSAMYVALAMVLYGPDVFRDILSPILWSWIWLYTGIVIVLGQVAWNLALKYAASGDIALATSFSPLAAIIIAMALLGEDPGAGLLPGAALIGLAILIGRGLLGSGPDIPATITAIMRPSKPATYAAPRISHPIPLARIGARWKTLAPNTAAPPGQRRWSPDDTDFLRIVLSRVGGSQ
ncbi:EamA-like transporter family protein [Roseovarius sp. THAF9]|uniref:DMT family transporter n=1 Tax=Roseovarius sp. THAF9 TaxID=2587847 RepID=UPI0012AA241E|nr:DMT family transporter [Roseovarius sp. THAF9]QFT94549.1 EamA-like transporter family protein [Roseovarius sp. THAF9]